MRILFITLPRSKSNWAVSTASEFYNVPNMFEPYRELFSLPHDLTEYRKITDSLAGVNNLVMKIETTQLTDKHNQNKIIDLNVFDLDRFDKIYTTSRENIVDMVCSHRVAVEFDRWLFTSDNPAPALDSMAFDPTEEKSIISILSCLNDINTLNFVHGWLNENQIPYTPLVYETMHEYARDNWNNVSQTFWAASEYDYSKIFTNYEEIFGFINRYR